MSVETLSRPNAVPTHIILSVGLRQRLPFCYSVVLYRYLLPNNAPFRKRDSSPARQFAGLFRKIHTRTRTRGHIVFQISRRAGEMAHLTKTVYFADFHTITGYSPKQAPRRLSTRAWCIPAFIGGLMGIFLRNTKTSYRQSNCTEKAYRNCIIRINCVSLQRVL